MSYSFWKQEQPKRDYGILVYIGVGIAAWLCVVPPYIILWLTGVLAMAKCLGRCGRVPEP